ncbi:unnamed protein product [Gemmataceae bacterium]|nr:unnamed protein product [Gemmataceae bacterium]VTT97779.1 unnamed protein product [Gemmataceae bacterium]
MNNNTTSFDRYQTGSDAPTVRDDEETLVVDSRAVISPSQMVEQRLIGMLKASPLLVSQVQRRLTRSGR